MRGPTRWVDLTDFAARKVGGCLRTAREARHVSLTELATRTGFTVDYITQVENGEVGDVTGDVVRIIHALGGDVPGIIITHTPTLEEHAAAYHRRVEQENNAEKRA